MVNIINITIMINIIIVRPSGSGIGITQSSNALALNTYFKEKRRIATGFSWSTTALGPIVWPYIIVFLNGLYGIKGTLLLFSGFALHSFVCSLLLQPVEWHTKFKVSKYSVNPFCTLSYWFNYFNYIRTYPV